MSSSTEEIKKFIYENNKDIKSLTSNLGISILIVIILVEFFNRITNNFITIFKNYTDDKRVIYGSNKITEKDSYNYYNDEDFNYKKLQILKTIRQIKVNNDKNFEDIISYKKKYNLDSNIESKIDRKVLSKDNDNYKYTNSPNIFDFILDIFKPTKA
tara:strand:+ start:198 stop:668 length:471 start_codon:yes stop_codon:yes gene_type:complete